MHVTASTSQNIFLVINLFLRTGIEDYNATAVYIMSINPITTGIDGRIQIQTSNGEISQYSKLLLVVFSTLLFYFKLPGNVV